MSRQRVEHTIAAYLPKGGDPEREKAAQDLWRAFKAEVRVLQGAVRFRELFRGADDERDD